MIKKASLLTLVFFLLLVLLSSGLVYAQSGLTVLDSSAQAEFPAKLHFSVSARSDSDITDIRLRYTIDRASFALVTSEAYIEFTPATKIDVSWTLEMVKIGGLPSGANLQYWWLLEDAAGNKTETAPSRVQFNDNRYSWRSLAEGKVTIHWYAGEQSFARELMASAQQALAKLAKDTGAHLEKPVEMYIYADAQDLKGAMIYPQEWTGGVTFTRYGIIAIGIAPDNLGWGKRVIAHELTHLVIYQMTFNPYSDLPTWLNEGLAMYAEGPLEPGYAAFLSKAITEGSLISVRSLSSPFSAYAQQSYLAYAQSYSLLKFLIDNYGQDKMLELLNTFSRGSSYDDALNRVYGFDMDGLDALWQDYVAKPAHSLEKVRMRLTPIEALTALVSGFLAGLGMVTAPITWSKN